MNTINKKLTIFLTLFFSFFLMTVAAQEQPLQWKFDTKKLNDSVVELQFHVEIQDKWHLYAQQHKGIELPLTFHFKESGHYTRIDSVWEAKPKTSYDEIFEYTSSYYEKKAVFTQKVLINTGAPFEIKGSLDGQSCIDGRCVAFDEKFSFPISGFEHRGGTSPEPEEVAETETAPAVTNQETTTEASATDPAVQDTKATAEDESLLQFFLVAFLGGLAGLLMPCVFPMLPMTVSYFLKLEKNSKLYAAIFGLSVIVIFLLLGILLSLIFGPDFANILSTHWIPNLLFAFIFIVFAISLFGYFEITLPSSWVNKSAKMESVGGIIGVFFMALTLVLVSFSCTLPIAGAVALNSAGGSFFKPIIGMIGFAAGIALPFTLSAFFPGMLKNMPKSGGWMNTFKVVLAFVELAFALKFINVPDQTYHWGILDREVYLAFWIVIFALLGFYLIGKIRFPHDDEMTTQKSWPRFFLAIGVFTFVVYLIPGMFGAPLKAISGWLPPVPTQDFDIHKIVREESGMGGGIAANTATYEAPRYADKLHMPHGIKAYFDYHQALKVAKIANKPVFIDFTGHGCVNCRNVESAVWVDQRVKQMFANEFIVCALYVDDKIIDLDPQDYMTDKDGETITKLGKKNMYIENNIYKENSQPCYFVVDIDGSVLAGPTFFETNVENYMKFLQEGIDAFNAKHGK